MKHCHVIHHHLIDLILFPLTEYRNGPSKFMKLAEQQSIFRKKHQREARKTEIEFLSGTLRFAFRYFWIINLASLICFLFLVNFYNWIIFMHSESYSLLSSWYCGSWMLILDDFSDFTSRYWPKAAKTNAASAARHKGFTAPQGIKVRCSFRTSY